MKLTDEELRCLYVTLTHYINHGLSRAIEDIELCSAGAKTLVELDILEKYMSLMLKIKKEKGFSSAHFRNILLNEEKLHEALDKETKLRQRDVDLLM